VAATRETFSPASPGIDYVSARFGDQEWFLARTPEGAVYLGELAADGVFGPEAQREMRDIT